MKKDLLFLLLGAYAALASLFCLISLRVADDYKDRVATLEQQLYVSDLKRDYFEWRDGTAIGHAPDVKFSRQKEWDALQSK